MTWDELMQRLKVLGRCSCGRRPCLCGTCHDCEDLAFRQLNIQAVRLQALAITNLRQRIKEGRGIRT